MSKSFHLNKAAFKKYDVLSDLRVAGAYQRQLKAKASHGEVSGFTTLDDLRFSEVEDQRFPHLIEYLEQYCSCFEVISLPTPA